MPASANMNVPTASKYTTTSKSLVGTCSTELNNGTLAAANSVIANATPVSCNSFPGNPYTQPSVQVDGIWDYQRCTELQPDSFCNMRLVRMQLSQSLQYLPR